MSIRFNLTGLRLTPLATRRSLLAAPLVWALMPALGIPGLAQARGWLINSADRSVLRAGELSRPFDRRADVVLPRIDTLLFLTRRMRRALVWSDEGGLLNAHDAFERLWSSLRDELAGKQPTAVGAVQRALAAIGTAPSPGQIKRLDEATRALGAAVA